MYPPPTWDWLSNSQETAKQQLWKSLLFACIIQERNKSFPSVKSGDTSGFRKFYNFLLKCEVFSKSTAWNALESQETLCFLVSKLPGSLKDRWNKKVQVVRKSFGREPCLSDFASFVHEGTTLVMILFFQRMLYWSIFRLLKRNTIKIRNMKILSQNGEKW